MVPAKLHVLNAGHPPVEFTHPCILFDLSTGETRPMRTSSANVFVVTASGDVIYTDGKRIYQLDPLSMRENLLYAPHP